MAQELISPVTPLEGPGPWLGAAFDIAPGGAIKLTAYGLTEGDRLCVRQIYQRQDGNATHQNSGCAVECPDPLSIIGSVPYTYCGQCVCMCLEQPILRIRDPGNYMLEFSGPGFASRQVTVVGVKLSAEDVSDALLMAQCSACQYIATSEIKDCEGNLYGYGFDPFDKADPAATVEIKDCDGVLLSRIYPSFRPGHSAPVTACGQLIGYAVNAGNSASTC